MPAMVSVAKGEIPVGLDLGGHEYEITPELVAEYSAGVDDHNAWYSGPSPFGGPVAPALILHSEVYKFGRWYVNIWGNLHAKQEWELYAPVMVGERVSTHATIVDRYVKRAREYVVNEAQIFGADGRLLCRGRTHQSFVMEVDAGALAVDKEREKRADRKIDTAAADFVEELEPLEKPVTIEMMKTFSPGVSYHNDAEQAKKLGFPDIVVQGMMPICFLSEFMTRRFGEGWFAGGRMSVNLVNVLWGADGSVACRGRVREYTVEGARRRAHCDVWVEKRDGTKVIAGTASAVVA
jgi:hypothetical protein